MEARSASSWHRRKLEREILLLQGESRKTQQGPARQDTVRTGVPFRGGSHRGRSRTYQRPTRRTVRCAKRDTKSRNTREFCSEQHSDASGEEELDSCCKVDKHDQGASSGADPEVTRETMAGLLARLERSLAEMTQWKDEAVKQLTVAEEENAQLRVELGKVRAYASLYMAAQKEYEGLQASLAASTQICMQQQQLIEMLQSSTLEPEQPITGPGGGVHPPNPPPPGSRPRPATTAVASAVGAQQPVLNNPARGSPAVIMGSSVAAPFDSGAGAGAGTVLVDNINTSAPTTNATTNNSSSYNDNDNNSGNNGNDVGAVIGGAPSKSGVRVVRPSAGCRAGGMRAAGEEEDRVMSCIVGSGGGGGGSSSKSATGLGEGGKPEEAIFSPGAVRFGPGAAKFSPGVAIFSPGAEDLPFVRPPALFPEDTLRALVGAGEGAGEATGPSSSGGGEGVAPGRRKITVTRSRRATRERGVSRDLTRVRGLAGRGHMRTRSTELLGQREEEPRMLEQGGGGGWRESGWR